MNRPGLALAMSLAVVLPPGAGAQEGHEHHAMQHRPGALVMGDNPDRLPRGCPALAGEVELVVRAGRRHAADLPGAMYAYDRRDLRVPPCSRVRLVFHNDDEVRHQWMLHGLPRYLYPGGMFHVEANGGTSVSGQFIVPPEDITLLVHCDIPQHTEKGMKAQLVVGRGDGTLWAIPGVSAALRRDDYLPLAPGWLLLPAALAGGLLAWRFARSRP